MALEDRLIQYSDMSDPAVILERCNDVVLCLLPDNICTPYVTWRLNDRGPESGNYHTDLIKAFSEFQTRAGVDRAPQYRKQVQETGFTGRKEGKPFVGSGTGKRAPAGSGSRGATRQAGRR